MFLSLVKWCRMLVEPVALSDFFLSFFSAAMIILTGALYAGLFAWAKISRNPRFYWAAGTSYIALLASVGEYSLTNNLTGYWLVLSSLMVIGYAYMPFFIWRLCAATHSDSAQH